MEYEILDIHQHIGAVDVGVLGTENEEEGIAKFEIEEDYKKRTRMMDSYGIKCAAIMPSLHYLRPRGQDDTKDVNNIIASYKSRYSSRFPIGFGTVEPLHGEKLGVQEIERIVSELQMNGIVWHHRMQGTHISDRRMFGFLKKVEELKTVALIHVFAESTFEAPWGLEVLADRFRDVSFVAINAFSGATRSREMLSIAKRYPNIFLETCGLFPLGRLVDDFVEKIGSQRILFGTDLYVDPPMYNYPHVLQEILASPSLTEQDKQNIFWNNARRLFKLG